MNKRRELAGKKLVRAKRNTKVLEGKTPFSELREVENGLLHIPRNTSKEYRRFGCINYKARGLTENLKLLENNVNGGHVTAAKQENIISKSKMTDSQSLTFWMKIES